jgi:membrane protease YdiL (CAAX protease family)
VLRSVGGIYCLAAIAVWHWLPGADFVANLVSARSGYAIRSWYAIGLVYEFYADLVLSTALIGAIWIGRPALRDVLGRAASRRDAVPIALTVVITFCVSGALTAFSLIALSYLVPGFVTWYLDWSYSHTFYVANDGTIPVGANFLRFVTLVVTAPLLEELMFRGYLLRAWSEKWGLWTGVLLSSAVFGLVHPDTVPAMLTGVGLALLYLRTQSLWAPIFAHAAYNLVVYFWNAIEFASAGWQYHIPTIDDVRSAYWIWTALAELVIVVLLIDRILKGRTLGPFKLPTPGVLDMSSAAKASGARVD